MNLRITTDLTEEDFNYFITLFEFNVSTWYPYSSQLTANSIISIHKKGIDPNGYFTKRKSIWKLINDENIILGFSVATEKRGGSVKFGPTMVVKDYRNQGIGSQFRLLLEDHYRKLGYRKVYLTTNSSNTAVLSYLMKLGYKIELHLKQHYTIKDDEIVLSKFLNADINFEQIKNEKVINNSSFNKLVIDYLLKYYDEVDEDFFNNLERTISCEFIKTEQSFIDKQKIKFDFTEDEFFAIVSPKRGGCIKICPLVFSGDRNNDTKNIKKLLNSFDTNQYHKFYTFVPIEKNYDRKLLEFCGFKIEGVFRKPYKKDVDMFIISFLVKGLDNE